MPPSPIPDIDAEAGWNEKPPEGAEVPNAPVFVAGRLNIPVELVEEEEAGAKPLNGRGAADVLGIVLKPPNEVVGRKAEADEAVGAEPNIKLDC